jgi:hypothetical protein
MKKTLFVKKTCPKKRQPLTKTSRGQSMASQKKLTILDFDFGELDNLTESSSQMKKAPMFKNFFERRSVNRTLAP